MAGGACPLDTGERRVLDLLIVGGLRWRSRTSGASEGCLHCRPWACGMPALSWSLNALMAAISSGVARSAVSLVTDTMCCISDHLLCFGAPLADGRSPC